MNDNEKNNISNNDNDEYIQLKSAFGIDTNSEQTFGFVNNSTIFYLVGCNLVTFNIETMKQKLISFKCSGRIEIIKITHDYKSAILVDIDQKNSSLYILEFADFDKKKPFKKFKIIENEIIKSLCISNDTELIACTTSNWNLLIFSFQKLKILDQIKAVSSQSPESTIENVSFFPNDNKRLLISGNKLVKIFLYTKKGLKFVYSLDCDFSLISHSWLNKNELLSFDKYGNLLLIEPKQNLIRTIILNSNAQTDDTESNITSNNKTSVVYSQTDASINSVSKKPDKISIDSYEPKISVKNSKTLEIGAKQRLNSVQSVKYSVGLTVKCLLCIKKGFFLCFQNDDHLYFYENSKSLFTFYQSCILRLKKFEKFKQTDKNFKEIILNCQVNQLESTLIVLTNRKIVYFYDLNELFLNGYKEIELEPILDSFYSDSVTGIDYCIRKSILAVCTVDRWLILWNYDTNSIELKQNFDEDLFTVAFHPSGLYLILATTNSLKYMSIYLDSCKVIHVLNVHSCKNCIFSHGGHLFALIHGTIIQVYSSLNYEEIGSIKSQDMGKIKQLRFSKDDHYLMCCSMAGIIRIWNSQTLILVNEITTKGLSYLGLDLHPNQEWLYLISTEKTIRQFQMTISEEYKNLIKPNSEARLVKKIPTKSDENVTCIEISKSGKMICIGTNRGTIRIYSLINQDSYREYKAHFGSINSICISYGDECLITSADDGSIIFWNISNKFKETFSEINQSNEEILIDKDEFIKKSKIIASYEEKLKESRIETNFKLRMKDLKFNIKKRELKNRFNNQMIEIVDKIESLQREDEIKTDQFNLEFDHIIMQHLIKFEKIQHLYEHKIQFENNKNLDLISKIDNLKQEIQFNQIKLDDMRQNTESSLYESIEQKLQNIRDKSALEFLKYEHEIEELIKFEYDFEDEIENEIIKEKNNFELEILSLIHEAQGLKRIITDLKSDFKSLKNSINSYIKNGYKPENDIIELKNQIKNLEESEINLKLEIDLKETELAQVEIDFEKLLNENENLENKNIEIKHKNDSMSKAYLDPVKLENKQLNIEMDEIKKEIKQKMLDLSRLRHDAIQYRIKNRLRKFKKSSF